MASNMWQQTDEMLKKHEQSGGLWLKLANDGDKAVVVFLGQPHPREVCFVDGKYVPLDDKAAVSGKVSLRVAFNVGLLETSEVKVLEVGAIVYKDLVRVRDKYGLDKWAFEIQRNGGAKDPKTTYRILPEHQLTAEQQKAFQALPLNDLAKLYDGEEKAASSLDSYDKKAEGKGGVLNGPIPLAVAQGFVSTLKSLPRAATDSFLSKFGIQKIKDLPAAQVEKARAVIEQLQSEFAAPPAADVDVDPFA